MQGLTRVGDSLLKNLTRLVLVVHLRSHLIKVQEKDLRVPGVLSSCISSADWQHHHHHYYYYYYIFFDVCSSFWVMEIFVLYILERESWKCYCAIFSSFPFLSVMPEWKGKENIVFTLCFYEDDGTYGCTASEYLTNRVLFCIVAWQLNLLFAFTISEIILDSLLTFHVACFWWTCRDAVILDSYILL